MALVPKGENHGDDSKEVREFCLADPLPLLRWFLSGCADFGQGPHGDDEPQGRDKGTISITGSTGDTGSIRVVLREPSSGVCSIFTYKGELEDLFSSLESRFETSEIGWTVDKFAKRR